MKIFLVTHFFPPGHPGGTESYTYTLARALRSLGHAPQVLCAEGWGQGDNWEPRQQDDVYDGIPVRRTFWNWARTPDPFVYSYDNPEINRRFADWLEEISPDVVHLTSCYAFGAGIIREAKEARVPTFMTLTDFWFMCPRHTLWRGDGRLCDGPESALTCQKCMAAASGLYQKLTKVVPPDVAARGFLAASHHPSLARLRGLRGYVGDADARLAVLRDLFDLVDVPIAPSKFLRDTFGRNGFPAERIRLSAYGHDLSWQAALRPREPGARLRFGYIGQIDRLKGVDVLVKAFQAMDANGRAELAVYGNLDKNRRFSDELRAIVDGNPDVRFMGSFERPEIAAVLSSLDVVVVPSVWYENTPIVVSEAFAARKPVVATNLGGVCEHVDHDVNGLVFERADVPGLAAALRRFVDEPSLLDRLQRGIKPVRTIDEDAADLVQAYGQAASLQRALA